MKEKHNVECKKCGHSWESRSSYKFVSCPSCNQKCVNGGNEMEKLNKNKVYPLDMTKKSNIKFVYYGRLLKKVPLLGYGKGDINEILDTLSHNENVPKEEIEVQFY